MTQAAQTGFARKVAVALAGAGAASMIFAGVANAAPAQPQHPAKVPGTNCTVAQVEKALAKEDPALWNKINANPKRKKHFESMITLTKQQREQKREQWLKKHPMADGVHKFKKDHQSPQAKAEHAKHKKEMQALKKKVIATCSQF